VNSGVPQGRILALAFNKDAAEQVQRRLATAGLDRVRSKTFHSFGYAILKDALGWHFDKAHLDTAKRQMRAIVKANHEIPPKRGRDPIEAFLDKLSLVKMNCLDPAKESVTIDEKTYAFEPIYEDFLRAQVEGRFFGYDDMVYLAVRVLLKDPALRRRMRMSVSHLLVDEFQDLNMAQLVLMRILSLPRTNLFIVGDDDQMIYGWRGADARHILVFPERFPDATSHTLRRNYRCSLPVIRHSGLLIAHNQHRAPKTIEPGPDNPTGTFDIAVHGSISDEVDAIVAWVKHIKATRKSKWGDFGVLARYNEMLVLLEQALALADIPCTGVSRADLLAKTPVRTLFAHYRAVVAPQTMAAKDFEAILKRPNSYLTNEVIASVNSWVRLEAVANERVKTLLDTYTKFRGEIDPDGAPCSVLLPILQCLELRATFMNEAHVQSDQERPDSAFSLDVAVEYAARFRTHAACLATLEAQPAPRSGTRDGDEVNLRTFHRAKGLEYQHVALLHCATDTKKVGDAEDERRLWYVGMTRAIRDLLVTTQRGRPLSFFCEMALDPQLEHIEEMKLQMRRSALLTRRAEADDQIRRLDGKIAALRGATPELEGIPSVASGRAAGLKRLWRAWTIERRARRLGQFLDARADAVRRRAELVMRSEEIADHLKYRRLVAEALSG
jgi:DNA helicase-2/ATP-dependent DNA helicase PcrA